MPTLFLWLANSIAIISCVVALCTPWLTFYPLSKAGGLIPAAIVKGPSITLGLVGCFSELCDVLDKGSAKGDAPFKAMQESNLAKSIYHGTVLAACAVILCLILSATNLISQVLEFQNKTTTIDNNTRLGIQMIGSASLLLATIFYVVMVVEVLDNEGILHVGFWVAGLGSCISLGLTCLASTYETVEAVLNEDEAFEKHKGYGSFTT